MTRAELMAENWGLKKKLAECEKRLYMRDVLHYSGSVSMSKAASEMGKKGGKGRWRGLTDEQRSELARKLPGGVRCLTSSRQRWCSEGLF